MFYLFFPLICRLLGRCWWLITLLLVFVALGPLGRTVFAHGNEVWQEYSYLGGMDAIALGCLTAIAISRTTIPRSTIWVLSSLGTVLVLFSLGFSNQAEAWGTPWGAV
jgi:peptidoglycan/LPS O-acetylase OafA/YrhL